MAVKSLCELCMSSIFKAGRESDIERVRSFHGGIKYQRAMGVTDIRTLFMEVFSRAYPDGPIDFQPALGSLSGKDVENIECAGVDRALVFLAHKFFFDTGPEMSVEKQFVLWMCPLELLETLKDKIKAAETIAEEGRRSMYCYGEDEYAEFLEGRRAYFHNAYALFAAERARRAAL